MEGCNNRNQQKTDPCARLFKVGVNTEIRYKADFDNDLSARTSLTHHYTVKELTLDELAKEVAQHHNICNPCFNGSEFHRRKEFCQSADYVGIDIDNDKEVDLTDYQGNKVLTKRTSP